MTTAVRDRTAPPILTVVCLFALTFAIGYMSAVVNAEPPDAAVGDCLAVDLSPVSCDGATSWRVVGNIPVPHDDNDTDACLNEAGNVYDLYRSGDRLVCLVPSWYEG